MPGETSPLSIRVLDFFWVLTSVQVSCIIVWIEIHPSIEIEFFPKPDHTFA